MFNYNFEEQQNELTITLEGKFDKDAAQAVQDDLQSYDIENITKINFELTKTDYIASSGLRVFFFARNHLNKEMTVELKGAQGFVAKVLKMSGMGEFVDVD